jgi:hypothetical protein
MTPEEINAKLAKWLGWQRVGNCWHNHDNTPIRIPHHPNTLLATPNTWSYFNPYERIDHAWMLVEHVRNRIVPTHQRVAFAHWFKDANLFVEKAPEAARAICAAILEITEQAT